jgi:F-type H+-transporting ATPase subunit epsilon
MQLDILTPVTQLFSQEVKSVSFPGKKGSFTILNDHAPIVSTLQSGKIKVVDTSNRTLYFEISGGIVECSSNTISVLLESGKQL